VRPTKIPSDLCSTSAVRQIFWEQAAAGVGIVVTDENKVTGANYSLRCDPTPPHPTLAPPLPPTLGLTRISPHTNRNPEEVAAFLSRLAKSCSGSGEEAFGSYMVDIRGGEKEAGREGEVPVHHGGECHISGASREATG
jgi:hypothetical protein